MRSAVASTLESVPLQAVLLPNGRQECHLLEVRGPGPALGRRTFKTLDAVTLFSSLLQRSGRLHLVVTARDDEADGTFYLETCSGTPLPEFPASDPIARELDRFVIVLRSTRPVTQDLETTVRTWLEEASGEAVSLDVERGVAALLDTL
jgi:hypothetical protein